MARTPPLAALKRTSGETVVMQDGPFEFTEQGTYGLEKPLVIHTGDTVDTTCVYDNDSNVPITFGENTENEMCYNFAVYYPKGALNCVGGLPGGGFSTF